MDRAGTWTGCELPDIVSGMPIILPPDLDTAEPDPTMAELLAARPQLSMQAAGGLMLEDVPLAAIADALGTPTWVTGAGTLRARYRRLRAALDEAGLVENGTGASVHYAVKANDHLAVLRLLSSEGAGADVVSGGEFLRAREAGIAASSIVFSGVGKSADELRLALGQGIGQINVESAEEIAMLSAIAHGMDRRARIALRVNPDVDAGTHAKITTGRAGDKFGIPHRDVVSLYAHAATLPGIEPVGLAVHIGSQIASMAPFRAAYERVAGLVRALRENGQGVSVVDCGGGLGVSYRNEPEGSPRALAGAIRATLGALDVRLVVEPGRWLAAPAGVLISAVLLVKRAPDAAPPFVVLDSAMNDLLRPSLYSAWHGLLPLSSRRAAGPVAPAHVVGPVCESGDTFARDRLLPSFTAGDRVAILDTGAYGAVMSSTYNARPLAAQALVDGSRWTSIRARQETGTLWRDELMPSWFQ